MPRVTCSHCHTPWVKPLHPAQALSCQSFSCYFKTEAEKSSSQSSYLDLSLYFSQATKFKVENQGIRKKKVRWNKPQKKTEVTKQLCLELERKSCVYSSCRKALPACVLFLLFQEAKLCKQSIKTTPSPNDCKEHFTNTEKLVNLYSKVFLCRQSYTWQKCIFISVLKQSKTGINVCVVFPLKKQLCFYYGIFV